MNHESHQPSIDLCPTADELSSILSGTGETLDAAEHLEHCATCQQTLERLAAANEPAGVDRAAARSAEWHGIALRLSAILTDQAMNPVGTSFPVIPGYRVIGLLGRGGMGAVYDAVHLRLTRPVAIKVVAESSWSNPELLGRFSREMVAIGQLNHTGIVRAYDAAEIDGLQYLVMEKVSGLPLSNIARDQGRLSVSDSCEIIRQVAIALQHAHENGLVHRDIKPSNVMVNDAGVVKVLDLGLARQTTHELASQDEMTSTGQIVGTIDYLSPEQASDSHSIDIRSDIYSLGTMFYKLLTGSVPYAPPEYGTTIAKLVARTTTPAQSVGTHRDDLPADVIDACDKMLMIDPQQRFQTPNDVVSVLKRFCASSDLVSLVSHATDAIESDDHISGSVQSTSAHTPPSRINTRSLESAARESARITKTPNTKPVDQQTGPPTKSTSSREIIIAACLVALGLFGLIGLWASGVFRIEGEPKASLSEMAASTVDGDRKKSALLFETMADEVLIPTLFDRSDSLTIEARFQRTASRVDAHSDLAGFHPMLRIGTGSVYELVFQTFNGRAGEEDFGSHQRAIEFGSGITRPIHLAGVRDAGRKEVRLYLDGKLVSNVKFEGTLQRADGFLQICGSERQWKEPTGHDNSFAGWIDELRISNFARYTDDFEPQVRLDVDEQTVAVYHFEEGVGDILIDSSGNNHHGTIHGAKWVVRDQTMSLHGTERDVATWILERGGLIEIEGRPVAGGKLPEGDTWSINHVMLHDDRFDDESLKSIAQLKHLKTLVITSANIQGRGLAYLENSSLEFISLTNPTRLKLEYVTRLRSLRELILAGGSVRRDDLESLARLENLKSLTLESLPLGDGQLSALERLPHLTEIALINNNLTDDSILTMPELPELSFCVIAYNAIGDAAATQLLNSMKLEHLSIDNTNFSDSGLLLLATLPKLNFIKVSQTNVTAAGVEKFKQALPKESRLKVVVGDEPYDL